ncbi:hypothetical protein [Arthrobacter sp. TMS1-12-1]
MSKAIDDPQMAGSHTADRATSGEPGTAVRTSSAGVGGSSDARPESDGHASAHSRRAADVPVDAVPAAGAERETRVGDSEAPGSLRPPVDPQGPGGDGLVRVETPTRRQLRLQQIDGRAVAPDPATDQQPNVTRAPLPGGRRDRRRRQSDDPAVSPTEARQSIVRDAEDHLAGLQPDAGHDPFAVDPAVLAQQKALADRAAFLNSRARRTQELSGQDRQETQDRQRTPSPNDPTAAHNLSIVTPPEFVQVPGSTRSVLRAPTTSHIPIVVPRPQPPAGMSPSEVRGRGTGEAGGSRDGTGSEPIGARDAFGLDPLDAMTAGLGRLRRVRYLQYSLLVVGATALATGIIMTVSSLNG